MNNQLVIKVGTGTTFRGIIFTYQDNNTGIPPMIIVEKAVKIYGQVYSQGNLLFRDNAYIYGSIFTRHFLYQTSFFAYDNYLVNIKIDSKALPAAYLTSSLIPVAAKHKKVLQWLEGN